MTAEETSAPQWRELLQDGHLVRVLLLSLCIWLHAADSTLIATMIPNIIADIGGASLIGWTVALYEVGTIVAGAASGVLALRYGLRPTLAIGALVYAAGCLVSAIAPTMEIMLLGRLIQGLGGGSLIALSFVAVANLFPDRLMPRIVAVISAFWGASAFMGPLVGGLFADLGLWRWGFVAFTGQAIAAAMFVFAVFPADDGSPKTDTSMPKTFPIRRLAMLAGSVVAIGIAGNTGNLLLASLIGLAGLGALAAFFLIDARHDEDRLMPRNVLNIRHAVGAASIMIALFAMATIPYTAFGPVVIKQIHGLSALQIGLLIALSSVSWTVAAIVVSGAGPVMAGRWIRIGALTLVASVVGFTLTLANGSVWWLLLWATLEGAGFGFAWTFIMARATAAVEPGDRERLAAALPTLHRAGYALGAAFVGIVANSNGFSEAVTTESAKAVGFWAFAAVLPFAGIGLAAAWRLGRRDTAPSAKPA